MCRVSGRSHPIASRRSRQYADPIPAPAISRFCEAWGSPVYNDKAVAVPWGRVAQRFYQQLLAAQLPAPSDGSGVNVRHTCRYVAASRDIPVQKSSPATILAFANICSPSCHFCFLLRLGHLSDHLFCPSSFLAGFFIQNWATCKKLSVSARFFLRSYGIHLQGTLLIPRYNHDKIKGEFKQ